MNKSECQFVRQVSPDGRGNRKTRGRRNDNDIDKGQLWEHTNSNINMRATGGGTLHRDLRSSRWLRVLHVDQSLDNFGPSGMEAAGSETGQPGPYCIAQ